MTRWYVPLLLCLGAGVTLLFGSLPRFQHRRIVDRLGSYAPARSGETRPVHALRVGSVLATLRSLVDILGERLATITAERDGLAGLLERVGSNDTPGTIRSRQVLWGIGGLLFGAAAATLLGVSGPLAAILVAAPAAVAVLSCEHRVREESRLWQQRLADELPVVAEQLGMLLGSGYSLGGAMQRIAQRGRGVAAAGLADVLTRVRHGVGEIDALREWAARAQVPSLDHLVSVLALNWEANDLSSLISADARAMRREAQRRRLEQIERRSQQVWIPVTVATLLPGVIFMAVPFVDAMRRLVGP